LYIDGGRGFGRGRTAGYRRQEKEHVGICFSHHLEKRQQKRQMLGLGRTGGKRGKRIIGGNRGQSRWRRNEHQGGVQGSRINSKHKGAQNSKSFGCGRQREVVADNRIVGKKRVSHNRGRPFKKGGRQQFVIKGGGKSGVRVWGSRIPKGKKKEKHGNLGLLWGEETNQDECEDKKKVGVRA